MEPMNTDQVGGRVRSEADGPEAAFDFSISHFAS